MATKKQQNEMSKSQMQDKIAADTQAFLKGGGKIDVIPRGQSGVDAVKPGPKHIKLGGNKK